MKTTRALVNCSQNEKKTTIAGTSIAKPCPTINFELNFGNITLLHLETKPKCMRKGNCKVGKCVAQTHRPSFGIFQHT